MSINKLFKILLASTIALPMTFSAFETANAQSVVSRQKIVNSLQRKSRARNTQRRASKRSNRRQNNRSRASRKKATPQRRNQRARPPSSQVVNKFRAPGRAPARAPVLRSRPPQPQVTQKFRAPPRAPQRARVPTRTPRARAPQQNANALRVPSRTPRARAPQQNANAVRVPSRTPRSRAPQRVPQQAFNNPARTAPNRNPQRFNQEFASTDNFNNGRAIRIEQQQPQQTQQQFPNLDNASVDLEILFEYNSARISRESVRQLIILGEALHDASLSQSRILIAGHTDAAGSRGYNNDLSFRRARSVSDFLVTYAGIAAGRLYTDGYGEDRLKYPDAPNSGQNRRVEIINMGQ